MSAVPNMDMEDVEEGHFDRTKTMILSKSKLRPNLPEMPSTPHGNSENTTTPRERNHQRRCTVTVAENPIASEIAQLLNEVADENPDDIIVAVQRKMTAYLALKESKWQDEARAASQKQAALYQARVDEATRKAAHYKPSAVAGPERSSPDQNVEYLIAENNENRDKYLEAVRIIGEMAKQHENFVLKEKNFEEQVAKYNADNNEREAVIEELTRRYYELRTEAETKINEANREIDRIMKQHEDDTLGLRTRYRRQEMTIKSLEAQLQRLELEKQELMDMCDSLVEKHDTSLAAAVE
uniref:TACC_C domain-containing protein n=1 Tax=Panagrellus redivivus TaxID=6233 RepID=A0A7E4UQG7_PANRE